MEDYRTTETGTVPGGTPDAGMLSLSARIDQLHAAIRNALEYTSGVTYYPHLDVSMPDKANKVEPSVLEQLSDMMDAMIDLNQRLARIREVIGGRL